MTCDIITTIRFNGNNLDVETGINILYFLRQQNIIDGRFIVVNNNEMIPKSQYKDVILSMGDDLEIISPITGG